jgi:predicted amidophosphoribosyltransferase
LLGNDSGIEQTLKQVQQQVTDALSNEARIECDRYVRERPDFFAEETASIFQLRQTLQQACRGYDYQNMVDAEPAIRQLLKLDFEEKVKGTILKTFRQSINQTLNHHLLNASKNIAETILNQYDQAHAHLVDILEKEAQEKVKRLQQEQAEIQDKIYLYNESIEQLNDYLLTLNLEQKVLISIKKDELNSSNH